MTSRSAADGAAWSAWLVDDEAERVRAVIERPLLSRGIELQTFPDIDSCLRGVHRAKRPADLFIGDLMFRGQDGASTGGLVALRFFEVVTKEGWQTIQTLLTQYLEQYLEQLRDLYVQENYAARLIVDKGFFQEPDGAEVYADVLRGLLTGVTPPVQLVQEEGLPSLILQREIPEVGADARTGHRAYAERVIRGLNSLARPACPAAVPYGSAGLFLGAMVGAGLTAGSGVGVALGGIAGCASTVAGLRMLRRAEEARG